ncbi:MAG: SEC-C domain-containing protein [Planctomycetaceae bacterium]|nr:SEC-C domain-containing protein [Planctomycetaceae bacterium]
MSSILSSKEAMEAMFNTVMGSMGKPEVVEREVAVLRAAVKNGDISKRGALLNKLSDLMSHYCAQSRYKEMMDLLKEADGVAELLYADGKIDLLCLFATKVGQLGGVANTAAQMAQINDLTRKMKNHQLTEMPEILDSEINPRDMEKIYSIHDKWMPRSSEKEFSHIKNEWANSLQSRADRLYKSNRKKEAFELVERILSTLEPRMNYTSLNFTDWRPLIDAYRTRALWKSEAGDLQGALADMNHYDELADKGHDAILRSKPNAPTGFKQGVNEAGEQRIIIKADEESFVQYFASVGFEGMRYETALMHSDLLVQNEQYEEALRYIDKSMRIAKHFIDTRGTERGFDPAFAIIHIPMKKVKLLTGMGRYEEAIRCFDIHEQDIRNYMIGEKDTKQLDKLEQGLAVFLSEKYTVLVKLKKFDEAEDALNKVKDLSSAVKKEERRKKVSFDSGTYAVNHKTAKDKDKPIAKKLNDEELETQIINGLTIMSNMASLDSARGGDAMTKGRYKTALVYFFKARNIFDSTAMIDFAHTRLSLMSIYLGIGRAYAAIGNIETAEKWYNKTYKLANETLRIQRFASVKFPIISVMLTGCDLSADMYFNAEMYSIAADKFDIAIDELESAVKLMINSAERKTKSGKGGFVNSAFAAINLAQDNGSDTEEDDSKMQLGSGNDTPYLDVVDLLHKIYSHVQNYAIACLEIDQSKRALKLGKRVLDLYDAVCGSATIKFIKVMHAKTALAYAALLFYTGKVDEAESIMNTWTKKIAEAEIVTDAGKAQEYVDEIIAARLVEMTFRHENPAEYKEISDAYFLMYKNADEACKKFVAILDTFKKRREEAKDSHRINVKHWDMLVDFVQDAVDWCNGKKQAWNARALVYGLDEDVDENGVEISQEVKRRVVLLSLFSIFKSSKRPFDELQAEPDDIDQELAEHETDFDDPADNMFPTPVLEFLSDQILGDDRDNELLNIFKKFNKTPTRAAAHTGTLESSTKVPFKNADESSVGRNDPCPCGSGKKYKRCCGQ